MECTHEDYYTLPNVGFDIDEWGEEDQHLDVCKSCGATRMRVVRTDFDGKSMTSGLYLGKWQEKE